MSNIAYITSGKVGIHSFTYYELLELEENHEILLCLTQLNKGPYMPSDDWNVIVPQKKRLLLAAIKTFISSPSSFLSMLSLARKHQVTRYFLVAVFFYQILKNKKIDLLHCQMGDKKLYIGYFLKKFMNLPLTVTIHAHELYQRSNYEHPDRIRELLGSCNRIVTISDFNKDILVNKLAVPEDKITVMRLFPEPSRIERIFGKKKILTVANWVEKKGYRTIIEAVKNLRRDDFIWMIVGGPTFSENSIDLRMLVKENQLENKILLLGQFGKELLDIVFSSCDIFCLPSITERYEDGNPAEREGIPVAIMEAMGWGKPVISTRHAGIPELIDEILIEENDVEGLIHAVNDLLDDAQKRKELGIKNRETIHLRYKKENVKILSDIFERLSK